MDVGDVSVTVGYAKQVLTDSLQSFNFTQAVEEAKAAKKDKRVKEHQGQLLIAAGQIGWAGECEKALGDPVGARTALASVRKRWDALLARLSATARSTLSELERNKVPPAPDVPLALA